MSEIFTRMISLIWNKTVNSILMTEDNIPARAFSLLELKEGEIILFHKKISLIPFFINGEQDARTNFVITSNRLIFLDYYRYPIRFYDGWRKKDSVPLHCINRLESKMKKRYLVEQPELSIVTASGKYELVLKRKHFRTIHAIGDLMKRLAPQIDINIDLPESKQSSEEKLF